MTYYCSECSKECQPELCNAGIQSGCHEEARVLVADEDRVPLFAKELTLTLNQVLRSNEPYETVHAYFMAPLSKCECHACDLGRQWEAAEARLDETAPGWDTPPLRPLTESEESELNEELWAELRAEETPSQRVQRNWREGS